MFQYLKVHLEFLQFLLKEGDIYLAWPRCKDIWDTLVANPKASGYDKELTLDNLRKYDLKSGIFNLARSWKDVSASTLSNGWNRLIRGTDPVIEFEGFETANFHRHIVQAGETATEEDVSDWLDGDEGDPGYQTLTDAEIADSVLHPDQQDSSDYDDDDDVLPTRPTASAVRQAAETLVEYLEHPNTEAELRVFATSLREIRDIIFCNPESLDTTPDNHRHLL
ncbi:Tigger transposable element-derived protein 7 [Chionoecetes opilio]|uniref:Tigger transposable element-derived protein 7 n=1 Tax=Chionoecetes opilio TaxID=41210 RepID=A0A8J4Y7P0_CHIOP|nr:Tigger transposable element-derived protein 7 [Chionoecetes opilio]